VLRVGGESAKHYGDARRWRNTNLTVPLCCASVPARYDTTALQWRELAKQVTAQSRDGDEPAAPSAMCA